VMCTDHPVVHTAGRPYRGSPRHHLWRKSAGRRAAGKFTVTEGRSHLRPSHSAIAPARDVHRIAISTPCLCPDRHNAVERHRRSGGCARASRSADERIPQGASTTSPA
jgi:hypothetical protein